MEAAAAVSNDFTAVRSPFAARAAASARAADCAHASASYAVAAKQAEAEVMARRSVDHSNMVVSPAMSTAGLFSSDGAVASSWNGERVARTPGGSLRSFMVGADISAVHQAGKSVRHDPRQYLGETLSPHGGDRGQDEVDGESSMPQDLAMEGAALDALFDQVFERHADLVGLGLAEPLTRVPLPGFSGF